MNLNISKRIFLIVFITITSIFTILFGFQYFFIDEFYYNQKVKQVESDVNYVLSESENISFMEFMEKSFQLESETDLSIGLLPKNIVLGEGVDLGTSSAFPVYFLGETVDGEVYPVTLELDDEQLAKSISYGEIVNLSGVVEDGLLLVTRVNGTQLVDLDPNSNEVEMSLEVVSNPELLTPIFSGDVIKLDQNTYSETFQYFTYEDSASKDLQISFQKEVLIEGNEYVMTFETSLQSVRELSKLLMPFYAIFYLVGLVLAFILSSVLSKRISKPIVMITDKTNQMAQMNFEQRIDYTRDDELGQLSNSINTLSENLGNTLSELKETNESLLNEIEKERNIEANRKTFISNVSHELKTPISISRGYLEAIKDQVNPDKQSQYIDIVYGENEKMNEIVKSMLTLLKAESNTSYKLKPKNIDVIMEDIKEYFSLQLSEKDMTLELSSQFGTALIDEVSFKSVMINLVSNAINYGLPHSTVVIEHDLSEKLHIKISNKIDSKVDVESIFTRFYTADSSRNSESSGTGLGLSIVKAILDSYQSELKVSSTNEEFSISFSLDIARF